MYEWKKRNCYADFYYFIGKIRHLRAILRELRNRRKNKRESRVRRNIGTVPDGASGPRTVRAPLFERDDRELRSETVGDEAGS